MKTVKVREEDEAMEQSEDCLTINITVPKSAIKNKQKVPINYFIHGGNNQQGLRFYRSVRRFVIHRSQHDDETVHESQIRQ